MLLFSLSLALPYPTKNVLAPLDYHESSDTSLVVVYNRDYSSKGSPKVSTNKYLNYNTVNVFH